MNPMDELPNETFSPLKALSNGTTVANLRLRRVAIVVSSRCVDQYHGPKARGIGFQPVRLQDNKTSTICCSEQTS